MGSKAAEVLQNSGYAAGIWTEAGTSPAVAHHARNQNTATPIRNAGNQPRTLTHKAAECPLMWNGRWRISVQARR